MEYSFNIRGLLNKIDEMRTVVTECNFDVMGICETFLDDNVTDNEICIEGYTIVKKNRNRYGEGVLIYIKEGIQPRRSNGGPRSGSGPSNAPIRTVPS